MESLKREPGPRPDLETDLDLVRIPLKGSARAWRVETTSRSASERDACSPVGTAVFGSMSFSKWSSAQSNCQASTSRANHAQALSDKNDASTDATVSMLGFVVGGLAVAGRAVLFLLAPGGCSRGASAGIAPCVGPGSAGMLVKGVF